MSKGLKGQKIGGIEGRNNEDRGTDEWRKGREHDVGKTENGGQRAEIGEICMQGLDSRSPFPNTVTSQGTQKPSVNSFCLHLLCVWCWWAQSPSTTAPQMLGDAAGTGPSDSGCGSLGDTFFNSVAICEDKERRR